MTPTLKRIGDTVEQGSEVINPIEQAVVVLVKDSSMAEGYKILTSYPQYSKN